MGIIVSTLVLTGPVKQGAKEILNAVSFEAAL